MQNETVDARSSSSLWHPGLSDADETVGKPKFPVNCAGVLVRDRTQIDIDGPSRSLEVRTLIVRLLKAMRPLRQIMRVTHEIEDRRSGRSDLNPLDVKCTHGRLQTGRTEAFHRLRRR